MQTQRQYFAPKVMLWPVIITLLILITLPLYIPGYYVYLMTLVLVYALFATSLNLVLGYGGMLQLHPAVFFGLGAYGTTLLITKTSLPLWLGFIAGPLTAALFAVLIGWVCVRLRGLYFGMLTLALGQLVWSVVYRWYELTGGDDGIHGIVLPEWLKTTNGAYFTCLVGVTLCFIVLYRLVKSPFGMGLQAIRDNPQRSESVGIDIKKHRLLAFIISGFFAGFAGVLFVVAERSVSPNLLFWSLSAEVLIMCLLGGMYTFWGPAVGALTIIFLRSFIGSQAEYWLLILGIILLLIVLLLPEGLLGYLSGKLSPGAIQEKAGEKHAEG